MATIYRKTTQGQEEIESRHRRLAPRLRAALILVDGRRSEEELRRLIPAQPQDALQALLEQGLIEAVAPAPRPSSAAAAAGRHEAFVARRLEAVRTFTDLVGPLGESMALKLEKAAGEAELRALLERAVTMIGNLRGGGAAASFAVRFLGDE